MPITPLHFGLLAPANHFLKDKISNVSFILVNIWIDIGAIEYTLFGTGAITHGTEHSFLGTTITATFFAMLGVRSMKWVLGAYLAGFTHTILDMLVHSEMNPFEPVFMGNPYYMDWMQPLSLVLLPLFIWLIAQYVSNIRGFVQRVRGVVEPETVEPLNAKH